MSSWKTYTTGSQVTRHPLRITITFFLEVEHSLEFVAEGKVQSLSREVTDNIGSITTPQRDNTFS
jgi:hypothetical protein